MYAVASHLPVIDYIPEWLANEVESDLNTAICNLTLNNDHLCDQIIDEKTQEERERQMREYEMNEAIRCEIDNFELNN